MCFIVNDIGVIVACAYSYIRNAEACYGFEKNAECRLRCGLQLQAFLDMQPYHYCCQYKHYSQGS